MSGLRGALRVPRDHSPRLSRDGERQDEGTGTTLTGHLYAFSRPSRRRAPWLGCRSDGSCASVCAEGVRETVRAVACREMLPGARRGCCEPGGVYVYGFACGRWGMEDGSRAVLADELCWGKSGGGVRERGSAGCTVKSAGGRPRGSPKSGGEHGESALELDVEGERGPGDRSVSRWGRMDGSERGGSG